MSVRFDHVEVFEVHQYLYGSITSSITTEHHFYTVDNFESRRKNKRRTMKQFHLSDLYREEIWVNKQTKSQKLRTIVEVDEIRDEDDISSPSSIDRLAMQKVQEDYDKKIQRLRNKRLFKRRSKNRPLKVAPLSFRESVSGSIVF